MTSLFWSSQFVLIPLMQLAAMRVSKIKMVATEKTNRVFYIFRRYLSTGFCNRQSYDSISEILSKKDMGSTKSVQGWVQRIRKMKGIIFLDLNDGSCTQSLQILFPAAKKPETLSCGTSVKSTGIVQCTPRGQIELSAEGIEVVGLCHLDGYPFVPKHTHSFDYCRQYLHFRSKLTFFSSLFRIRHTATAAVHDFFKENGFIGVHTPILTANDCEGAGEVFTVQPASKELIKSMKKVNTSEDSKSFFNVDGYLTVSGQMHLEIVARSFLKAYTFNPTFRAENTTSRHHLAEFYMIEAEESFVDDMQPILDTIERLVKSVTSSILSKCGEDIAIINKNAVTVERNHSTETLERLVNEPFVTMTYAECISVLQSHADKLNTPIGSDKSLSREHEKFLATHTGGIPVFVTDWPKSIKPFYMKATKHNPELVSAVDLLVPNVGELVGGSLREDDYNKLLEKLTQAKLIEDLKWYLDLRKYGNVPTGGFGMGFERYLQWVLNISNIKDTIPFPRWPHSLQL